MLETLLDYDLNVFRQEVEQADGQYAYADPWYIEIYLCITEGNAVDKREVGLIELTSEESAKLQLGTGYFDYDDSWYGFDGFLKDYEHQISDRLWTIFNALPSLPTVIEHSSERGVPDYVMNPYEQADHCAELFAKVVGKQEEN